MPFLMRCCRAASLPSFFSAATAATAKAAVPGGRGEEGYFACYSAFSRLIRESMIIIAISRLSLELPIYVVLFVSAIHQCHIRILPYPYAPHKQDVVLGYHPNKQIQ